MSTLYVRINCPLCSLQFAQEKKFVEHCLTVHGKCADEQLFVDTFFAGQFQACACGCSQRLTWYGWKKGYASKYVRGHNAKFDTVFSDPIVQQRMIEKRCEGYASGRLKVWNDGLTKETSSILAAASQKISESGRAAYESGKHVPWQKGLTKETSESLARASESHKQGFKSGKRKNWSEGLTKETDERLARAACAASEARKNFIWKPKEELIEHIKTLCTTKFELVTPVENYKNKYQKLEFVCTKCKKISSKNLMMIRATPVCFFCHPKESLGQLEIFEFVKSLASDAILSDRTVLQNGKELDIFVPSAKFAIEYNGLYYHSEVCQQDKLYHDNKVVVCSGVGIKLFHVFEDEWRDKRLIVESMIRNALKQNTARIFARKCEIKALTPSQRKIFFESSHIDGDVRSEEAWGLFHESELVSAISVRKPIHKSKYRNTLEVARFATKLNTTVVGGLSKLTSTVKRYCELHNYSQLLTYVDTRIGNGESYRQAGFINVGSTAVRFWWTDFVSRLDRFSVRASEAKSQKQAALEAGVVQIWGCRNLVFVFNDLKEIKA